MNRFETWLLHLSTGLLALSGISFAVMKYAMEPLDPFAVVNHFLQPWALSLHVLAAPVIVLAVGLIAKDHIWGESRRSPSGLRLSGVVCLAAWGIATLSGYLLQTATHEGVRLALIWSHLTTAGLFLLGYLFHLVQSVRWWRARRPLRRLVPGKGPGYNNASDGNLGRDQPPSVEGLA